MSRIELRWGVRIPLRDGVHLNATVYLPGKPGAGVPALLALTPYVSDSLHRQASFFAAHDLAFVVVDVRGRGNSEGVFRPLIQEAQDGHDVVEWLAHQSFCNGKVAMWGGSYAGFCQWATAKEHPPHLKTIVPMAAPCAGIDFPMRNNISSPYLVRWLRHVSRVVPIRPAVSRAGSDGRRPPVSRSAGVVGPSRAG
jgi:putative CocE/NonD family hydrolase